MHPTARPAALRLRLLVPCVAAALCAPAAWAATPAAWAEHDREAAERCIAASTLQRAKASGRPVVFDDGVGHTAVLLSGRHPRTQKRNLSGRELCLYHRASGVAHIADADRMGTPRH